MEEFSDRQGKAEARHWLGSWRSAVMDKERLRPGIGCGHGGVQ